MTPDRLDAAEIKRRIEAARILRGIGQAELDRLFHEDGLGKGEAGRTERGDLPMTRVRREAFSRHLGVPERWFTAASIDEIVGLRDREPGDSIEERLERIELIVRGNAAAVNPDEALELEMSQAVEERHHGRAPRHGEGTGEDEPGRRAEGRA